MATKVKSNEFVVRGARKASVASKLDKMVGLLGEPKRWAKGTMQKDVRDSRGLLAKDKDGKVIMAYCMVGAGIHVGDGAQLWYELCYTIEAPRMAEVLHNYGRTETGNAYLRDMIISFNDRSKTQYTDIKKVLRVTRDRVKKYGLGHFPKLAALLEAEKAYNAA